MYSLAFNANYGIWENCGDTKCFWYIWATRNPIYIYIYVYIYIYIYIYIIKALKASYHITWYLLRRNHDFCGVHSFLWRKLTSAQKNRLASPNYRSSYVFSVQRFFFSMKCVMEYYKTSRERWIKKGVEQSSANNDLLAGPWGRQTALPGSTNSPVVSIFSLL